MHPLDEIKDPYRFQQIVAEYFRCVQEPNKYHVGSVSVIDNGIGGDDCCDILVEFVFDDSIFVHTHRWVIECKSQGRAVNLRDIDTKSIDGILKSNNAQGYLLICKNDATASLKRIFKGMNNDGHYKYITWNGSQLWRKFSETKSLLKAFFPKYYKKFFIDNDAEKKFNSLINKFNSQLNEEDKK